MDAAVEEEEVVELTTDDAGDVDNVWTEDVAEVRDAAEDDPAVVTTAILFVGGTEGGAD